MHGAMILISVTRMLQTSPWLHVLHSVAMQTCAQYKLFYYVYM